MGHVEDFINTNSTAGVNAIMRIQFRPKSEVSHTYRHRHRHYHVTLPESKISSAKVLLLFKQVNLSNSKRNADAIKINSLYTFNNVVLDRVGQVYTCRVRSAMLCSIKLLSCTYLVSVSVFAQALR